MSSPTILAASLVVAAFLIIAAVLWSRALLLTLPFLAILNGVPLTLNGSRVRLDQIAALLLVAPLAASALAGVRRFRVDSTTRWLIALLAMNVIASVVNSPARAYSLLQCANLASAWIIYVVILNGLDTAGTVEEFFMASLLAALAAAAIGVGAFVLAVAGIPVGGAEVSAAAVERLTRAYGAYGTMVEPNIFGSFSAAMLTLAVGCLAAKRRAERATTVLRWTAVLSGAGLLLSFTRSAWVGAIVGLVWIGFWGRRTIRIPARRILLPMFAGMAMACLVLLLPGSAGTFLRFKVVNLFNLGSATAAYRLLTYSLALQQTAAHPIIGWGTFSFAPLLAEGNDFAQFEGWRNLWIGNYLLLALHDTGVLGLALWIGLLWSIITGGVRAMRATSETNPLLAVRSLALTAAVVSLLVPFLATTGFTLGYPWVLIGLLGAHARLARDRAQAANAAPALTPVPLPPDVTRGRAPEPRPQRSTAEGSE